MLVFHLPFLGNKNASFPSLFYFTLIQHKGKRCIEETHFSGPLIRRLACTTVVKRAVSLAHTHRLRRNNNKMDDDADLKTTTNTIENHVISPCQTRHTLSHTMSNSAKPRRENTFYLWPLPEIDDCTTRSIMLLFCTKTNWPPSPTTLPPLITDMIVNNAKCVNWEISCVIFDQVVIF